MSPRAPARRRTRGFTLVEAMVSVAVLAIALTLAVPSFSTFMAGKRVATGSQELLIALTLARSEAIKRNRPAIVTPAAGGWHDGWAITSVDAGGDEVALRNQDALRGVEITTEGVPNPLVYQRNGRLPPGVAGRFIICDTDHSASVTKRIITIDFAGRAIISTQGDCAS